MLVPEPRKAIADGPGSLSWAWALAVEGRLLGALLRLVTQVEDPTPYAGGPGSRSDGASAPTRSQRATWNAVTPGVLAT